MKHIIRCKDGKSKEIEPYTRGFAIKAFCTECLDWGDNPQECTAPRCPLFPYRKKTLRTQKGDIDEWVTGAKMPPTI
jgi:hypothetical protein